jgi:hypothetical protein
MPSVCFPRPVRETAATVYDLCEHAAQLSGQIYCGPMPEMAAGWGLVEESRAEFGGTLGRIHKLMIDRDGAISR